MSAHFEPKEFLKNLVSHPGVYQMIGDKDEVLYVGKAQNLKKRVTSYFQRDTKNARISALVRQIKDIKIIIFLIYRLNRITSGNSIPPNYVILIIKITPQFRTSRIRLQPAHPCRLRVFRGL